MMYTDIRKRILTTAGIVLAIVILLVTAFLIRKNRPLPDADTTVTPSENSTPTFTESSNVTPDQFVITPAPKVTVEPQEPDALYAKQTARIFVERFASYSNQNNNLNIDNVLPLVTDSMRVWIETQRKDDAAQYEGLITSVVASTVTSFSAEGAEVVVDVQQRIDKDGSQTTGYKSGVVQLVRDASGWKVDSFYWET